MSDLTTLSAHVLAHLIASGEVSSEEVVRAHVDRAVRLTFLNALAFDRFDDALREARALDARRARGDLAGPLHGVPVTVKDWIEVRGLPCLAGDPARAGHVPTEDATAVARLRAAGAVVLGKTAVLAESEAYGRVLNPYGEGLSPGGSSSGEAALIAAMGSPLGLGSDSGGSIRQPAGFCGIVGLKPSSGRVPLTGHDPRINPIADPRTVIGPMARTVEDVALALDLVAGEDFCDASVVPVPTRDFREVRMEGLRVAFYDTVHGTDGEVRCAPDVSRVLREAASALQPVVADVREDAPPRLDEALPLTRQYWARPESASWDAWLPDGPSRLTADEVERHLFEWDRFRRSVLGFMRDTDVILTPISTLPPSRHGEHDGGIWFTAPYSLAGYPAVVVPCGTTPEGHPVAVQVVARPWREDVALAVASVLEQALGGYRAPNREALA